MTSAFNASATSFTQEVKNDIRRIFALQCQHQKEVGRASAKERIAKLKRLHQCVLDHRAEIEAALWADLRKNPTEVAITEIAPVLHEIRYAIAHIRSWMTTKKVGTPLPLFRSTSEIVYEPKGLSLVISPWNFPFNLSLIPLASAIAAGNCVVLKPSEYSPNSSTLLQKMLVECFPPGEVTTFLGDAEIAQELLSLPFNHIFFTGSPQVGKIVMRAAAEHLCSVTLELGGKSPVIVDETADLDTAAAKIAWLNTMNAGQICIAPDYVLAHESIHDKLVKKIIQKTQEFYGTDADTMRQSADYCRIIHPKHLTRLQKLQEDALCRGAKLAFGGQFDEVDCFYAPTLLTQVPDDAIIWQEEIFGPILPIKAYAHIDQAISMVNAGHRPLAMYIFSQTPPRIAQIIGETRCGGVTVNDCGPHFYNLNLPFGGINNSGIGKCHGEFGFLEFSNARGVTRQVRFFPTTDLFLPPYKGRWKKWLLEVLVRWM